MSRRRRTPLLLLPLLLLGTTLGACGDEDSSSVSTGLDAVSIQGEPGSAPSVTWKSQLSMTGVSSKTLVTGDGPELQDGDLVVTNIWIGDGYSKQKAFSTYHEGKPEVLTLDDQLGPVYADALEGATVGSRIAVAAPADQAFGESGNPQLGIGNKDSVVLVLDLMSTVPQTPEGTARKAPAWAPTVQAQGDDVTGLDFTGTPTPEGRLRSAALIAGKGPVVKKGQTIYANYLGQVYGASKPFDESYSSQPFSRTIGAGELISGWDKTLVGARVGSRVVIEVPPEEGYGSKGNPDAGIKGTDTLYFVVDLLAAV